MFHIMSRILEAANGMCLPLPPGKSCVLLFNGKWQSNARNSSQKSTSCSTCVKVTLAVLKSIQNSYKGEDRP